MGPTKEAFYNAQCQRHGEAFQKKLSRARVAVCGLGGLGSNVSMYLARAGVGTIHLLDFDTVDVTNLHRQQYAFNQVGMEKPEALRQNLTAINPFIRIETDFVRLDSENIPSLLAEADVICECFDGAESKALLVNTVLEQFPHKYIVAASGMAGISDANSIRTRRITSHFYLCGDEQSDVNDGMGLFASRVGVCAAHQAHKVLQIIHSFEEDSHE